MSNRRAHQCHRDSCASEAEFLVDLHLNCNAPGITRQVSLHASIQVCAGHKDDVRPYVLSEQNQASIRTALMDEGIPEPDFLSARLEFIPIPHDAVVVVVPEVIGCDRDGCANPARWRIKQSFRALVQNGKGSPQRALLTNLYVCDKHRKDTKAADLLTGEDRARTRSALNEVWMLLPDLDGMVIEFLPLVSGEPETKARKRNGVRSE